MANHCSSMAILLPFYLILSIKVLLIYCDANTFNSVYCLHNLLQKHFDFLNNELTIKNLSQNHEEYLDEPASESERRCSINDLLKKSGFNLQQVAEHPVAAYASIKCLLKRKKLSNNEQIIHEPYLKSINENDQKGAALSLVRLQESYNLSAEDILNGQILNYHSNISLSDKDCLLLTQQAFLHLKIKSAKTWTQTCKLIISEDDIKSQEFITELHVKTEWLSELLDDKNSTLTKKTILNLFPELNQDAVTLLNEKDYVYEVKNRMKHNTNLLCRGLRDKSHLMEHVCTMKRNPLSWVPYFVEHIYKDPNIVVYHDFLNDKEIEHIKMLASEKLTPLKTFRFNDGEIEISSRRVGKMARFPVETSTIMRQIFRKVERITGLSTESAEDLQVQNYGIGGHYEVHMDFLDSYSKGIDLPTGDRIATFLIYMNDVEYGGSTAFPQLRTAVNPKKGSAVFWYNLKPNGKGDYRTLHAACPVLMGTKWVSTVWLHTYGQEFRRPCLTENV